MKSPRVGIVGYGKMGQAIFSLLRRRGYATTVVCRTPEKALEAQRAFIKKSKLTSENVSSAQATKHSEEASPQQAHVFHHDPECLRDADIIIESVSEDLIRKKALFEQLEGMVRDDTLLVSNTSSVSINAMSSGLRRPERFCGLHFFYPLSLMAVVEIIKGDMTAPLVIQRLESLVKELGKWPIVVRDGPGSVINGILVHYYAEGMYILEEGIDGPSAVDQAARKYFYAGPCESIDTIGIELFLAGLKHAPAAGVPFVGPIRLVPKDRPEATNEELGGRQGFYFPPLLTRLHEEGHLGKKVGKGLYRYDKGRAYDYPGGFYFNEKRYGVPREVFESHKQEYIARRLLFSVFNGTLWAIYLGFLAPVAGDLAIQDILQMRAGPVTWMRQYGLKGLKEAFQELVRTEGVRFDVPIPHDLF